MRRVKWRRYLPKRPRFLTSKLDILFSLANTKVARYVGMSFEDLDRAILAHKRVMDDMDVSDWLTLLIMQAPRAAHAQAIMKEYPHGYHDRRKRLLELIDFNDTFVSMILLLPDEMLPDVTTRLKHAMDDFCNVEHSLVFDDEQFEAVMHGLSREIAVFKAADNAGLNALMSSRMADAFGIDMQIADTVTGHYINIDCKTSSAFHFRLKDLIKHGRVDPKDLPDAETKGWWEIENKGDHGKAKIILLRVSQDEFGVIHDFRFENEQLIVERLRQIIVQRGLHDGHFGGRFIETLE